jgi:type I restriction enzyme S subunit
MVWNEGLKREIPEGWENGTFANYCPSTGGFAFKSNWWTDKGVAVAKIKDIQENYTLDTSDLARVDISDKEIDDKFLAKPGDVLIAMTGATVGKYAIVPITDYPIYVNQRVGYFNLGIDPTQKLPFLINSMNQSYFRNAIFTLANGAAQPNISNEQINSIQLLIPEDKLIKSFNEMFQPYYKKILNNQLENQKLTELRDWLLPMLMNGQVKVMDKMENELSMAAEPKIEYGK